MKTIMKAAAGLIALCLIASAGGCRKQDPMLFGDRTSVYLTISEYTYSFQDNPGKTTDRITCPIKIMGKVSDRDRVVKAALHSSDDHKNTADPALYKILDGVVPAGSEIGSLYLELNYDQVLDDTTQIFHVRITPSEDFPDVQYGTRTLKVEFSAMEMQPANWNSSLTHYFGTYSTNWWQFIKQTVNMTSIPYWPYNQDTETWWMSEAEFNAIVTIVRRALRDYNQAHPNGKMKHEDGKDKGQEVVMP